LPGRGANNLYDVKPTSEGGDASVHVQVELLVGAVIPVSADEYGPPLVWFLRTEYVVEVFSSALLNLDTSGGTVQLSKVPDWLGTAVRLAGGASHVGNGGLSM
jgi:hypothetical protein